MGGRRWSGYPTAWRFRCSSIPGIGEKDHERFARTYDQSILFFRAMRKKGAPVSLAIDPASGHNAGNSRYLTIPWIYGALEGQKSDEVVWPSEHSADGNWFPSKTVGNAWKDFTATGMVSDQTAPRSAPFDLRTQRSYWGGKADVGCATRLGNRD